MRKIAQIIALFCLIAITLLGWMIYAYSIYIASELAGWMVAPLTLVLPVAAQIYWITVSYLVTGVLLNSLLVACLAWVVLFLLGIISAVLAKSEFSLFRAYSPRRHD